MYLLDPRPEDFEPEAIAHALSLICRRRKPVALGGSLSARCVTDMRRMSKGS